MKFKNYGKTPAKEIKVTEIKIDSIEIKNIDTSLKMDSTQFAILVSDREQSIRLKANTPYYSIAEKHGKVFFIGKIMYKDIFNEEHQTQFPEGKTFPAIFGEKPRSSSHNILK